MKGATNPFDHTIDSQNICGTQTEPSIDSVYAGRNMMESLQLDYSLRQLRYFIVTAEVLSFTAAAKLLHISQPSVSASLAALESSFGVQLFIRHHAIDEADP